MKIVRDIYELTDRDGIIVHAKLPKFMDEEEWKKIKTEIDKAFKDKEVK